MDMKLLREAALDYHRVPTPSKIHVAPTKGLTNQHDLWLAFSPGVAYACLAIRDNSQEAATLTFLTEIVPRADLFLESSAGSVLNPDVLNGMEADPLTLALASQSRRSGPSWRSRCVRTRSRARGARTIPTRSITFSASPSFSAAPSMWGHHH